ncbi:TPA: DUF4314 domain-containing protein [Staphylococcus aureus]|nr:DUF4314 domain-containing protein [Staphylococcus aureus]HDZ6149772.1 DUF4314 domain-containing protein [Staphylococcus aureus]
MSNKDICIGDRVRLISTEDKYTTLMHGDCGTVTCIDDINQVHVLWDNNLVFALIPELDEYEKI